MEALLMEYNPALAATEARLGTRGWSEEEEEEVVEETGGQEEEVVAKKGEGLTSWLW